MHLLVDDGRQINEWYGREPFQQLIRRYNAFVAEHDEGTPAGLRDGLADEIWSTDTPPWTDAFRALDDDWTSAEIFASAADNETRKGIEADCLSIALGYGLPPAGAAFILEVALAAIVVYLEPKAERYVLGAPLGGVKLRRRPRKDELTFVFRPTTWHDTAQIQSEIRKFAAETESYLRSVLLPHGKRGRPHDTTSDFGNLIYRHYFLGQSAAEIDAEQFGNARRSSNTGTRMRLRRAKERFLRFDVS